MNWEVSTMQSKRSFFNPTLFKKNLSRSWPLWGVVTAVGCLVPLYLLLALLSDHTLRIDSLDFIQVLYGTVTAFVPAATFAYAILVAMVVWSYLYNSRSVGLMHTLPIDRTALFVTNVLSGFAMLLIPYVAVGGFVCILALIWGFMDFMAVVTTVVAVLLMTALFFGMATLCAMITGNVFGLPVFYLIVNFAAPALDALVSILAQSFLVGVQTDYTGAVEFLSPLVQIYQKFDWRGMQVGEHRVEFLLEGFGTVAIYGLIGLVFFALAWLLYQRRASESAGDLVAFRWLRPVFRYGVALVSAMTTGHALYAIIWGNLFQKGEYAELIPMAVCLAVAGVVGYYGASMLLEKSLRVFKGSISGVAAVTAVSVLICVGVGVDILGVEGYVPEMEEIDEVYFYASDILGHTPIVSVEENPQMVEKILALHTAIAERTDELRGMDVNGYTYESGTPRQQVYQRINFRYTMKDGTEVHRGYTLYLTRENWERDEGIEGAYKAAVAGSDLQLYQVQGPKDGTFSNVHVYCYDDDRSSYDEGYELDERALYEAVMADAHAGRLYDFDPFDDYYNDTYPVNIEIEYRARKEEYASYSYAYDSGHDYDEGYYYDYYNVDLRPTMTSTISELLAQGFITAEDLAVWNEGFKFPDKIAEKYGMLLPEVVEKTGSATTAVIGGVDAPTSIRVG